MRLVYRAQGGSNAEHTILAVWQTYKFHILPSGLLSLDAKNLVGSRCRSYSGAIQRTFRTGPRREDMVIR